MASGELYVSSSRSHAIVSPVGGCLMLTALILSFLILLDSCSADSFRRYLVSRVSSSPADRSESAIALWNDVFQAQ